MARPKAPSRVVATTASPVVAPSVEGMSFAAGASVFRPGRKPNPQTDRYGIAKAWQIEAYRHVHICGEARYAVTLFAALAGRAEIGISEPQTIGRKAVWVDPKSAADEIAVLAEIAPTVRDRARLIRDYMTHRIIAGECYLIARDKVDTDPGYESDPNTPLWEIVAVTEIQKVGTTWRVRHENGNWLDLSPADPVIRLWAADPENRQEAWSPFRSLIPTLREIEWLTKHIFTQVRSRLMSAGVWFLPENLTFPPPPPDAVDGGAEAIASLNEAEQFMLSLASSAMGMLDDDEVSFPSVVMADPAALANIDQKKLIQFWSEIDDKAMVLRSDAVRRFALGMDLPPEQVIGSSGIAVTGSAGSAGSVNHWGVWANEEQTIVAHIEPALDDFCGNITISVLRPAVEGTDKVLGYDTSSLRLRQDRSKESIELYDRGELKGAVMLRENGFDPDTDQMDDMEFKKWLLKRIAGGSASPEQVNESLRMLGVILNVDFTRPGVAAPGQPGRNAPKSLESHPYEGPPRVQHDHTPAPYTALHASCEVLVLRALEKAGNRLLNDGKRGRDRDRTTPPHLAHLSASVGTLPEFDFTLLPTVLAGETAMRQALIGRALNRYCSALYENGEAYSRETMIEAVKGL